MAHIRTHIRAAVVALLSGTTTAGGRVYDRRGYKISGSPAINVMLDGEEIDYKTIKYPRTQQRTISVSAHSYADDQDTLDQIILEIELALYSAPTLGGLVKESAIKQTVTAVSEQSDTPAYRAITIFSFVCVTKENDPESAL